MSLSRRDFVRTGTSTALLSALSTKRIFAHPAMSRDAAVLDDLAFLAPDDELRAIALRAVDAARSAGATYADVRLTRIVSQQFEHTQTKVVRANVTDRESFGIGVRALIGGHWGFAASPYWDSAEATQLAEAAVAQARTNALGGTKTFEWNPIPVATGSWLSPGIDPFSVTIEEKIDFMNAWRQAVTEYSTSRYALGLDTAAMKFTRTEWLMVSTEGTKVSQIFYDTSAKFPIGVASSDWWTRQQQGTRGNQAEHLFSQRGGWDVLLDAKIRDQIPQLAEDVIKSFDLTAKPVEIGRYDVVFDTASSAALLRSTFAIATQLDRALGLEANAGGTSYLGPDPLQFLGTSVAAPLITVVADRSMPKGNATVQWDEEGVVPETFPLVRDGILVDYQTTREQAPWLKQWYSQQQRPVRSHGCAAAQSALAIPIQQPPNLVLQPGTNSASFETLISGTKRGYAIMNARINADFQAKNGAGVGFVREIVNGKLGEVVQGVGFLFNSMELWKNVFNIGDATSARVHAFGYGKGQPMQFSNSSISAVPIAVKNISIIDANRRA